jgi:peptide/nickel transport system substrate-binding protein
MMRHLLATVVASAVLVSLGVPSSAVAQKQGGILKVYHRDSPASMSILEEATISTVLPMMGIVNNLVVCDTVAPRNSVQLGASGSLTAKCAIPRQRHG